MGQTVVLGDSGRISVWAEMMSWGPWIPSPTKTSKSAQSLCCTQCTENSISGQRLDETHFESGDLIFPALLVSCVGTRG